MSRLADTILYLWFLWKWTDENDDMHVLVGFCMNAKYRYIWVIWVFSTVFDTPAYTDESDSSQI